MSLDAILFDLGNVLVFHDNALLCRNLAAALGVDVHGLTPRLGEELFERLNSGAVRGPSVYDELRRHLDTELPNARLDELFNSHFTQHDAMVPIVEALAEELRLILVSNVSSIHFDYLRPRMPVLDHFDHLVLSYEVGAVKPHARIFEVALERAGVPAERTAFFDDVPEYVEAARRHGIEARVFSTAEQFLRDLAGLGVRPALETGSSPSR